jgi:hypothetical protein
VVVAAHPQAAEHSGGGLLEDACPGRRVNAPITILDLAAEGGAMLIVSDDTDMLAMSPWRGTPVLTSYCLRQQVDAMRCHTQQRRC